MKIQKRRRRENKTDYLKRIKLLKSEKPRIVFRRTNKYIISQYIESQEAKDKIMLGLTSKKLLTYGWPEKNKGSLKSIPAAYLTGFIAGRKIIQSKLKTPIIDSGMIRSMHKTKLYAFIKGLKDSGLDIKTKDESFPEEERVKGESLKEKIDVEAIKSKIEKEK